MVIFPKTFCTNIAILHSANYTAADLAQLPTDQRAEIVSLQSQLANYQTRYKKQLGKTADPFAPIDRTTHRRKHYHTLNIVSAPCSSKNRKPPHKFQNL